MLVALAVAVPASAHEGEGGRIVVPGDHFEPGETITISGSGIGGTQVVLRLAQGETSVDLGQAVVAADRTFEVVATVPAGFPLGYAELTATEEDGHAISTIILIGDRAEGPGGDGPGDEPAGSDASPGGTVDGRTIGLALLGVGLLALGIAVAWYVRGRPKGDASPN